MQYEILLHGKLIATVSSQESLNWHLKAIHEGNPWLQDSGITWRMLSRQVTQLPTLWWKVVQESGTLVAYPQGLASDYYVAEGWKNNTYYAVAQTAREAIDKARAAWPNAERTE